MNDIFKKTITSCILVLTTFFQLYPQEQITLTFTGANRNNMPVKLNSVLIENKTQLWQEILIYPDTVLYIGTTNIEEHSTTDANMLLLQNTPNPFEGVTNFSLVLQKQTAVSIAVYNLDGKLITTYENTLEQGIHQFRAKLSAPQTYLLSARDRKGKMLIKMVNTGSASQNNIEHVGYENKLPMKPQYISKGGTIMPFSAGDQMKYIGYANIAGVDFQSEIVTKQQYESEVITLNFNLPTISASTSDVIHISYTEVVLQASFANNNDYPITIAGILVADNEQLNNADTFLVNAFPEHSSSSRSFNVTCLQPASHYYYRAFACNPIETVNGDLRDFTTIATNAPSCPSVITDYDGNTYNTVQIGKQCWMKENLRTKHYANGDNIPHYYDYVSSNLPLSHRGYLYNWVDMMHGVASSNANPSGVQGICPDGWHVPSDAEWSQLEYFVRNVPEYVCNVYSPHIAKALASKSGWHYTDASWHECAPGHTPSLNNATQFSAIPAGSFDGINCYDNAGDNSSFWSSTESGNHAWLRTLEYYSSSVNRNFGNKSYCFSVRCVRCEGDESAVTPPTVSTFITSNVTDTSAFCGGNVITDGGTTVIERGVCWSTSPTPTVIEGHISDSNGTGSFFVDITDLTPGFTYYVRAYATNSIGISYGNEICFTTTFSNNTDGQPCPESATITDYDGHIYNTVKIGAQCWMKENLRTTHYANGDSIPFGNTYGNTAPFYYVENYSNSEIPLAERGFLYNWTAVMHGASSSITNPSGVQGICPNGWHVPSDAEWTQLTNYVSSQNLYQCNSIQTYIAKALASTTWWETRPYSCQIGNESSTNNATGFSAVPRGDFGSTGAPSDGIFANFWSSTVYNAYGAWIRHLFYSYEDVNKCPTSKSLGLSVRCVKNYSF